MVAILVAHALLRVPLQLLADGQLALVTKHLRARKAQQAGFRGVQPKLNKAPPATALTGAPPQPPTNHCQQRRLTTGSCTMPQSLCRLPGRERALQKNNALLPKPNPQRLRTSSAFCTTRQPYICSESGSTRPCITAATRSCTGCPPSCISRWTTAAGAEQQHKGVQGSPRRHFSKCPKSMHTPHAARKPRAARSHVRPNRSCKQ